VQHDHDLDDSPTDDVNDHYGVGNMPKKWRLPWRGVLRRNVFG
jgi:hypothetical protein